MNGFGLGKRHVDALWVIVPALWLGVTLICYLLLTYWPEVLADPALLVLGH